MKRIKKSKRNALVFMALLVCVFTALAFRTLADEIEATSSSTEIQAISSVESAERDTLESTVMGAEKNSVLSEESLTKRNTPAGISGAEPAAIAPFSTIVQTGSNGSVDWTLDDEGVLTFRATNGESGILEATDAFRKWDYNLVTKLVFEDKLIASKSLNALFWNNSSLEEIVGGENLDTSLVEDMSYMFYNCHSLKSVNTSTWDLSNVKNANYAFFSSSSLEDLGSPSWQFQNIEEIEFMFYGCTSLKELDVAGWNTSKVTNMDYVFFNAGIESLDTKEWDISQVTTMRGTFASPLKELDVNNFNTSKVTDMNGMFALVQVETFDFSQWDTSQVTNMDTMFWGNSLEELDLSSFSTESLLTDSYTDPYYGMFDNCPN